MRWKWKPKGPITYCNATSGCYLRIGVCDCERREGEEEECWDGKLHVAESSRLGRWNVGVELEIRGFLKTTELSLAA